MRPIHSPLLRNRYAASLLRGVALAALAIPAAHAAQPAAAPEAIEEIIVTGTSIRGVQPVGSALVSLQREDITTTGAASTAELLAKTPQFSSFGTLPNYTGNGAIGVGIGVSLRSLPTLVLLDGVRQVGEGSLQTDFNINSIPQNAIERIEIVPDGGSAIYGSDAIGGVVNIITRRNLDGVEANFRYGSARAGYNSLDSSVAAGHTWDAGSAMISLQYTQSDGLALSDIPARFLDQSLRGGVDQRATSCFKPNIVIAGVTYVPAISPAYGVSPTGPARCDNSYDASLIGERRGSSVAGNVHHDLTDSISLFGTARYSASYSSDKGTPSSSTALVIRNTNPFFVLPIGAPAGTTQETLMYNTRNLTGLSNKTHALGKSLSLSGGLDVKLPADFHGRITANYGWGRGITTSIGTDTTVLAAAALGTTTATALDPFGNRTNPAIIATILTNQQGFNSHHEIKQISARADGPLFSMPGGDVKVAGGAEYYWQSYLGASSTQSGGGIRHIYSVFGELYVPLIGEQNAMSGMQKLELSGAVRYDHYNEQGPTTNPKIGVVYQPIDGFNLRGSYGTSFIAPRLSDTHATDTRGTYGTTSNLAPGDPRAPGPIAAIMLAGGNPTLKPQTSRTYSGGFDYRPEWAPGLRMSSTYYDVMFSDRLSIPPLTGTAVFTEPVYTSVPIVIPRATAADIQNILNIMLTFNFPADMTPAQLAAQPGGVQIYDARRHNFGQQHQTGMDIDFGYSWRTDIGNFNAGVSGNRVFKLANNGGRGLAFIDDITKIDWRIRGNIGYSNGPVKGSISFNYIDQQAQNYLDNAARNAFYVSAAYYSTDLQFSYTMMEGWMHDTDLSVNISNVFDQAPPFAYGGQGYRNVDPIGRMIWLGISKKF